MKTNILMGCLLLLASIGIRAEEFSITNFTIAPGGTADVEVCLSCTADVWGGFQFDMILPKGLHVVEDEFGMWHEVTHRLTYQNRKTEEFDVFGALQENGRYRIVVGNPAQQCLKGTQGILMKLRMSADDTMDTGSYPIGFEEIVFSSPDGLSGIEPEPIENGGEAEVVVNVDIGENGFTTLSWPRSLDFTDIDVEVYIGTKINGDVLQLQRVTKVPAHTGVIIVGKQGAYHPVTTEKGDDVSTNLLLPTDEGAIVVDYKGFYTLDFYDKIAFYSVPEGLSIPQYRAYLKLEDQMEDAPNIIVLSGLDSELKIAKKDLLDIIYACMEELNHVQKELNEKATEDEAPELYKYAQQIAEELNYTRYKLDQVTTLEEVKEMHNQVYATREMIYNLEKEIYELQVVNIFNSTTIEGVEMTFIVISEEERTAKVSSGKKGIPAISIGTTGSVTIPQEVNGYHIIGIGEEAFRDTQLSSVVVPASVTTIEEKAFAGCLNLLSVTLTEGLTFIGEEAFSECSFSSIILPESLVRIGEQAFECTKLISITLPKNVAFLGNKNYIDEETGEVTEEDDLYGDIFNGCSSLEEVNVDVTNTIYASMKGVLMTKDLKTLLYFPQAKNDNTILDGIETIYQNAFADCSFTSVTLPASLKAIGENAFDDCNNLTSIISEVMTPFAISNYVFSYAVYEQATLYVPIGTKNQYEATDGWNMFQNIMEIIDQGVTTAQYKAALEAIEPDAKFRIFTQFNGTTENKKKYYLTADGYLTDSEDEAYLFTFGRTEGDELFVSPGWKLDIPFSNPHLTNGATGDLPLHGHIRTDYANGFRDNWEGQVWYKKGDRYAVRSTNSVSSEWGADTYWTVLDSDGNGLPEADYALTPNFVWQLETLEILPLNEDQMVTFDEEIGVDENTDLAGTVVNNIFYNISPDKGSYDATEGCIIVTKPTSDEQLQQIESQDIFTVGFKSLFTGIVFKILAGKGLLKITAKTTGNTTLKVKIGSGTPIEKKLDDKFKTIFPYNIEKPSYVYVYAGQNAASVKAQYGVTADSEGELKIYDIELQPDTEGIGFITPLYTKEHGSNYIYNLNGQLLTKPQKGINIVNGKKTVIK